MENHSAKLNDELSVLKLELSDKKKDILNFEREIIEKENCIEQLREKICIEVKTCADLTLCIENRKDKIVELEKEHSNAIDSITDLDKKVKMYEQNNIILKEQFDSSKLSLQEKIEELSIKDHEMNEKIKVHKIEVDHLNISIS